MGYQIVYETEKSKDEKGCYFLHLILTPCFFGVFLWMVGYFWPDGRELLKRLTIPGEPEITLEAIEVFAQEVGSGISLMDAVRNFCLVVLNHGHSG